MLNSVMQENVVAMCKHTRLIRNPIDVFPTIFAKITGRTEMRFDEKQKELCSVTKPRLNYARSVSAVGRAANTIGIEELLNALKKYFFPGA